MKFKVKDQVFESSLEAQEYAESLDKSAKIEVSGAKPYQGKQLGLELNAK